MSNIKYLERSLKELMPMPLRIPQREKKEMMIPYIDLPSIFLGMYFAKNIASIVAKKTLFLRFDH